MKREEVYIEFLKEKARLMGSYSTNYTESQDTPRDIPLVALDLDSPSLVGYEEEPQSPVTWRIKAFLATHKSFILTLAAFMVFGLTWIYFNYGGTLDEKYLEPGVLLSQADAIKRKDYAEKATVISGVVKEINQGGLEATVMVIEADGYPSVEATAYVTARDTRRIVAGDSVTVRGKITYYTQTGKIKIGDNPIWPFVLMARIANHDPVIPNERSDFLLWWSDYSWIFGIAAIAIVFIGCVVGIVNGITGDD